MHGNLWELCRDDFAPYEVVPRAGDGLRTSAGATTAPMRGGSYRFAADFCRSAKRFPVPRDFRFVDLGARPVRALQ